MWPPLQLQIVGAGLKQTHAAPRYLRKLDLNWLILP